MRTPPAFTFPAFFCSRAGLVLRIDGFHELYIDSAGQLYVLDITWEEGGLSEEEYVEHYRTWERVS